MSIFRRDSDPSQTPSPARPSDRSGDGAPGAAAGARSRSRVARGTRIVGTLRGGADLLIEGEVEGRVELDAAVVVGGGGRVEGEIEARDVKVGGEVVGDVVGGEKVEILASGVVQGDVTAPRVVIAEGAFLKGRVEMAAAQGRRPAGATGSPGARSARSATRAARPSKEGGAS